MTPAEIVIEKLGIRPLARKLGVAPSTVLQWRKRGGNIPISYFGKLQVLGNFTLEELVRGR